MLSQPLSTGQIEARVPPANVLPAGRGVVARLARAARLFADLQVCTVRRDVRAWLAGRRGRVLEVGCGRRPYRDLVPPACAYRGIDRRTAAGDFGMAGEPEVQLYDGDRFPCADASCDALFHTEVLEHVFDTQAFLRECRRCLVPGGSMFLSVPFAARYHYQPHDFYRFTPAALTRLLGQAGFADVVVTARGTDITIAAYKLAAVPFRWAAAGWGGRALFCACLPLTLAALLVAHASLAWRLGSTDDCLGYSVEARAVPATE